MPRPFLWLPIQAHYQVDWQPQSGVVPHWLMQDTGAAGGAVPSLVFSFLSLLSGNAAIRSLGFQSCQLELKIRHFLPEVDYLGALSILRNTAAHFTTRRWAFISERRMYYQDLVVHSMHMH